MTAGRATNIIYYEEQRTANLAAYLNETFGESEITLPDLVQTATNVQDAKANGLPFETTTAIKDIYQNKIIIPGGFKIASDSGNTVQQGIIIEDSNNNQFVWIPVGMYNTNAGNKTNNLSRRTFTADGASEVEGDSIIYGRKGYDYYGEGFSNSTVAYNTIGTFKTNAIYNGGYYIGRYEQGINNVCKADVEICSNITRDDAKSQADSMYINNSFIRSELISSYAWDTAVNFICQNNEYELAVSTSSSYGNMGTNNSTLAGEYETDKYCNICDMVGNYAEWTTGYNHNSYGDDFYNCVYRGGMYDVSTSTMSQRSSNEGEAEIDIGFRVQLVIKNH